MGIGDQCDERWSGFELLAHQQSVMLYGVSELLFITDMVKINVQYSPEQSMRYRNSSFEISTGTGDEETKFKA